MFTKTIQAEHLCLWLLITAEFVIILFEIYMNVVDGY